jgi:hypothetical protein
MNKRLFVIQNGTLIGNPLSFNWDTMSITLNKMFDFHTIISKNAATCIDIQIYIYIYNHSSLELLSILKILP